MARPAHTYRASRRYPSVHGIHRSAVGLVPMPAPKPRRNLQGPFEFIPRKPLDLREVPRVRTWGEGVWTAHRLRSTPSGFRRRGPIIQ